MWLKFWLLDYWQTRTMLNEENYDFHSVCFFSYPGTPNLNISLWILSPERNNLQIPIVSISTTNNNCFSIWLWHHYIKGAEKLLRHLHKNHVPICLATSSSEDSVIIKTKNHLDLFSLFEHQVCGSTDPDVKVGKPAPDIFLVAASRFDPKPDPKDVCSCSIDNKCCFSNSFYLFIK